ncbi:MAG: right-handed parallel beta-helix repeat-containing protein [Thermoguttaceae bacterium]|nr:right-handed parallel beta-helix repeat-containing protein [Thermoguttaceae bacterium]
MSIFRNAIIIFALLASHVWAAEYYVDAVNGSDENEGTSPKTAWQSLDKVNQTELQPGDKVLFCRGQIWRGTLKIHSGEEGNPVVFSSYGTGQKPRIQGSVDLSSPDCWLPAGENLWKTKSDSYALADRETPFAQTMSQWHLYCEGEGKAELKTATTKKGQRAYRILCNEKGVSSNQIQFTNSPFEIAAGQGFLLKFRARASKPFTTSMPALMQYRAPWGSYGSVTSADKSDVLSFSPQWQEYSLIYLPDQTAQDGRTTFFIGDSIPDGCAWDFIPIEAKAVDVTTLGLIADVGNVIVVENGQKTKKALFKRWSLDELKQQGDFFSSPFSPHSGARTLYVYSKKNPAETYSFLEAAIRQHTAEMTDQSWFIVDGLAFGYTGAHGIKGADVHDAIIRNCDFFWIGGSHLYTENGKPTRYGNGIEFWCGAKNNLVENNRFWQVYDTAMTNQGPDDCLVENMVWRGNVTWLCEQSYETWLSGKQTVVDGLVFENNVCYDSGFGWSHEQRPDKRGTPMLSYGFDVKSLKITYRNNKFCRAANTMLWFGNNRVEEPGWDIDYNVYWQGASRAGGNDEVMSPKKQDSKTPASNQEPTLSGGDDQQEQKLFRWKNAYMGVDFKEYQQRTGCDAHSRWEEIPEMEFEDY